MDLIRDFFETLLNTMWDVLPIVTIIFTFQFFVIRKRVPHFTSVVIGFVLVLLGLTFFLVGLERALFPIGELMAQQLTSFDFIKGAEGEAITWHNYFWVYVFAFAIGATTTIAEPSLIAVAIKANDVSGGAIHPFGLRIAVSIGVAFGIALGTWRIVVGLPIHWFIIAGYIVVVIQTFFSPKMIIPLAYDSGGVTTSTVTVPLVSALGMGLASTVPGRSVLIDGFGLIAFASLFPIISVLGYAQLSLLYTNYKSRKVALEESVAADNNEEGE